MKKALSALALAFLTFCPLSSPAADMEQLEQLMHQAFGHQERMCVAIDALNREIALHPEDEKLLELRISAYGALGDPYSSRPDVHALAELHPDSPAHQLKKCMIDEATGMEEEDCRLCYMNVAKLCERKGRTESDEYLLALLLAGSPRAEEAKQRFLARMSDSPGDRRLSYLVTHFSRDMLVGRVERRFVRNPCPAQK